MLPARRPGPGPARPTGGRAPRGRSAGREPANWPRAIRSPRSRAGPRVHGRPLSLRPGLDAKTFRQLIVDLHPLEQPAVGQRLPGRLPQLADRRGPQRPRLPLRGESLPLLLAGTTWSSSSRPPARLQARPPGGLLSLFHPAVATDSAITSRVWISVSTVRPGPHTRAHEGG